MKRNLGLMLYQARLKRKVLDCRQIGLTSIDKQLDIGDFYMAFVFYEQEKGCLSLAEVLGLIPPYEAAVWENALESRRKLIDRAQGYERFRLRPFEKDGETP